MTSSATKTALRWVPGTNGSASIGPGLRVDSVDPHAARRSCRALGNRVSRLAFRPGYSVRRHWRCVLSFAGGRRGRVDCRRTPEQWLVATPTCCRVRDGAVGNPAGQSLAAMAGPHCHDSVAVSGRSPCSEGSPFSVSSALAREWIARLSSNMAHAAAFIAAPLSAAGARLTGDKRPVVKQIGRGLAIAIPVAGVIGFLLASADPVFASVFNLQIDPATIIEHVFWLFVGAWVMGGLLRTSLTAPTAAREGRHWR